MFWTFTQAQFSIALGVNEETWTRNILNVLTTPVTEVEYIMGIALFGLLKLALCLLTLTITTIAFFGFDLSAVGWSVIPIAAILVLNGWAMALLLVGLVLRFGQSAEILIWGVNYVVMAFSGVFFPVDALPGNLHVVASWLPTTQAFSALPRGPRGQAAAVGHDRRGFRRVVPRARAHVPVRRLAPRGVPPPRAGDALQLSAARRSRRDLRDGITDAHGAIAHHPRVDAPQVQLAACG